MDDYNLWGREDLQTRESSEVEYKNQYQCGRLNPKIDAAKIDKAFGYFWILLQFNDLICIHGESEVFELYMYVNLTDWMFANIINHCFPFNILLHGTANALFKDIQFG